MNNISQVLGVVLTAFFAVIAIILITALFISIPVYFLWNWLMPVIFGVTKITLLQALGLSVLSGLLFKSGSSHKQN